VAQHERIEDMITKSLEVLQNELMDKIRKEIPGLVEDKDNAYEWWSTLSKQDLEETIRYKRGQIAELLAGKWQWKYHRIVHLQGDIDNILYAMGKMAK
jgi:hypothetical protein